MLNKIYSVLNLPHLSFAPLQALPGEILKNEKNIYKFVKVHPPSLKWEEVAKIDNIFPLPNSPNVYFDHLCINRLTGTFLNVFKILIVQIPCRGMTLDLGPWQIYMIRYR